MQKPFKNFFKTKWSYFTITLGCAVFIIVVDMAGYLNYLELKGIDFRFSLRDRYSVVSKLTGSNHLEKPNEIAIIGIDDKSIARIKEPFILWDTLFAKVIEMLGESGSKVIGIDIIWSKSIDDFVERKEETRNALKKSLLVCRNKYHTAIVMGIGGVKFGGMVHETDNAEVNSRVPLKRFSVIVGKENFGVINANPDPDKFIRRQKWLFKSADKRALPFSGFDLLIARRYLEKDIIPPVNKPLINYSSKGEFPSYPFYTVLERAINGDRDYFSKNFRNKIVLIGITSSAEDRFPTPINSETAGMVIHANAINMYLHNNYIKIIDKFYEYTIIIFLSFLVGLISSSARVRISFICSLFLMVLYISANIFLFNANILVSLFAPLLSVFLTFGGIYIFRFVVEEKDKRRLADFFGRYVNSYIVEEILSSKHDITLKGKRKKICILFSDINDFTSYSEKRPPEEVVNTLNEYFSAMTDVIFENDGTLDKFIGDGIMAIFGDPLEQENPTLNAVKAAFAMRNKLNELNEKWKQNGHQQLNNGIGIHYGEAVIGNIGSAKKMEYTAVGDGVNLASRIENLTRTLKAPILMSENAYNEVKDFVVAESRGDVPIKGRSSIVVYSLIDIKNQQS